MASQSTPGIRPISDVLRKPIEDVPLTLSEEQKAFLKAQTGIADDDELKRHLLTVRERAFAICPYPCISQWLFTKLTMSKLFAYEDFLRLGTSRSDAVYLDLGCCLGSDIRKAIADGYPIENVVASDLRQEFWEYGHDLFKSTPTTFPVPFIQGNALDVDFLPVVPPFTQANPPSSPRPNLKSLTSLGPLQGHVSAIHASMFFHLFNESEQRYLVRALAGLLSPEPGSMIFGHHVSHLRTAHYILGENRDTDFMYMFSPDDWKQLWWDAFGGERNVRVDVDWTGEVKPDAAASTFSNSPEKFYWMSWSVTRL